MGDNMKNTILVLSLLIPALAWGQENPKPAPVEKKVEKEPPVTYFVRAEEGIRPTKNIIYLFDCSTSMGEDDRF